jgi:hypothetical protein
LLSSFIAEFVLLSSFIVEFVSQNTRDIEESIYVYGRSDYDKFSARVEIL